MFGCDLWVVGGHFFGEFESDKIFLMSYILKDIIATIMSQQYKMKLSLMCTLYVQVKTCVKGCVSMTMLPPAIIYEWSLGVKLAKIKCLFAEK